MQLHNRIHMLMCDPASPAMYHHGSLGVELRVKFLNFSYELHKHHRVREHAHLRPAVKVELPYQATLLTLQKDRT